MTDLQALLERVEKAEGPDQEIDAELHWLFKLSDKERAYALKFRESNCEGRELYSIATLVGIITMNYYSPNARPVATYTASIDAAVALVEKMLPERDFIDVFYDCGSWFAVVGIHDAKHDWRKWHSNDGAAMDSPALALLAALLRALIAKNGAQ
jgi:hypothetical protein